MRSFRKKLKVKVYVYIVYDREKKEELIFQASQSEVEPEPMLPENCVLLDKKLVEEKEVTYSMTPQQFVHYATIEE